MLSTADLRNCIACQDFTLLYFTAHALRLQISLGFPNSHFRCCAAPAPFSAACRFGLSIVLHMQYPWPYPQWPSPCTAPTIPTVSAQPSPWHHPPPTAPIPTVLSHQQPQPSCLTFRPLHSNRQLLPGHITCQPILHRHQPS